MHFVIKQLKLILNKNKTRNKLPLKNLLLISFDFILTRKIIHVIIKVYKCYKSIVTQFRNWISSEFLQHCLVQMIRLNLPSYWFIKKSKISQQQSNDVMYIQTRRKINRKPQKPILSQQKKKGNFIHTRYHQYFYKIRNHNQGQNYFLNCVGFF